MNKGKRIHPYIPALIEQWKQGKLTRREFVRHAPLLGMSGGAASTIAGLTRPKQALATPIQRGGTLRVSGAVQKVAHPAQFSWVALSNQLRQVAEYLTYTDGHNITHPSLLKKWEASDDLKTWTLTLRQGTR